MNLQKSCFSEFLDESYSILQSTAYLMTLWPILNNLFLLQAHIMKKPRINPKTSASTYNINIQKLAFKKMNCLQIPAFNEMMYFISVDHRYRKAISQAEKHYMIKSLGLQALNPSTVIQLINRNFGKTITLGNDLDNEQYRFNETVWALNQFKLFAWVSVCYAHLKGKELQKFTSVDYDFLHTIFTRKPTTFLEYHIMNLLNDDKKIREKWSQPELDLLVKIIKQEGFTFKWSEISYKLFEQSSKKFFRKSQKCREQWFNHLDPTVNRKKWTLQQDIFLFSSVLKHGTKWALISKIFNNTRTEHMIKNRYNSLLRKYQTKNKRACNTKLVERIYDDLSNRFQGIQTEDFDDSYEEIRKEKPSIQGNILQQAYFLHLKPSDSTISETNQPIPQVKIEALAKQLKKLRQFDLQQVLFSNSTIEIQNPIRNLRQVQLIEVEIFADVLKEYEQNQQLSLLL